MCVRGNTESEETASNCEQMSLSLSPSVRVCVCVSSAREELKFYPEYIDASIADT